MLPFTLHDVRDGGARLRYWQVQKTISIVVAVGVKGFLNILSSLNTFKWIFESYKAINYQIFVKLPQGSAKD